MEAYNKIYGMELDSPGTPGRFQVRILELTKYKSKIYLSTYETFSVNRVSFRSGFYLHIIVRPIIPKKSL